MAGTRWWIIQSFLIPLLLYVIIVCLGYGFFLVHDEEEDDLNHHYLLQLYHQKPLISSLLWKHITDMIWVNVYLPLFIYIPFIHHHHQQPQPQVVLQSSLLYRSNNDRIQMNWTVEETNDESKSMLHRITTTTTPPWNNNNINNNNLNHDKIYITLILDRTIKNWNEYLLQIQIWMDYTNHRQQKQDSDNDLFLLSALCPYIHPIQIQNIYRTDVIRNMTISNSSISNSNSNSTHDSNHYHHRFLSTSDRNLIVLLSNEISSFEPTSSSSHIVLYIPNETTYSTTTKSTTTSTTLVQISNENDSTTLSYFGIINPKHKHHHNDDKNGTSSTTNETAILSSHQFLDQIYNQYYSKCLHMVNDDVDATVEDTTHSKKTNHDRSILDQKSLYYHRTFTKWYQSILNRLDSIYMEMLEYQTTSQYSSYVYKPWSFQSLLIPIQNKLHTLINDHIMEWTTTGTLSSSVSPSTSSWLYNNTNYHETYQRLQQIEVTVQQLEQDMNDMKQTVVQNQSRILDLTIVIHNLPMEQYLAIFGPLLFPLIIPLCITFVREYIRYRKYTNRAVVR